CFTLMHKAAKKAHHQKIALHHDSHAAAGGAAAANGGGATAMCQQCDEKTATVNCGECGKVFCEECNGLLHKSPKKADHQRVPLTANGK
ncbi:B-box zinc finger protein, partial [Escherichia coli]|uniref:B-box zinc finger protein n=1 Tax=Escherichia coli TaxID=562 RepID=UPI003CE45032